MESLGGVCAVTRGAQQGRGFERDTRFCSHALLDVVAVVVCRGHTESKEGDSAPRLSVLRGSRNSRRHFPDWDFCGILCVSFSCLSD